MEMRCRLRTRRKLASSNNSEPDYGASDIAFPSHQLVESLVELAKRRVLIGEDVIVLRDAVICMAEDGGHDLLDAFRGFLGDRTASRMPKFMRLDAPTMNTASVMLPISSDIL